jgi:hypothetical protein
MSYPTLDALSNEKRFYFAMAQAGRAGVGENMTVDVLLALTVV